MEEHLTLMKSKLLMPALALCLAAPTFAQMPPLVDRDLYFGEVEIAGAQISPDGKFISFLKPHNGTRNIWVKKAEEPFSAAKPITNETKRPIPSYFWSRDGKYILYVQDQGGDENYNVYAVDPAKGEKAALETRNITAAKGIRAVIYSVPKTDPDALPSEVEGLEGRPEARNLVNIYAALAEQSVDQVLADVGGKAFSEFKPMLADLSVAKMSPITTEMARLMQHQDEIDKILARGSERAREITAPILRKTYDIVGMVAPVTL